MLQKINSVFIILPLLCLISFTTSETCVRYTFEQDFDELFTDKFGFCESLNMPLWELGQYESFGIPAPNAQSTSFISPQRGNESCMTSFFFPMQLGTTIEILIYLDPVTRLDDITLLVLQIHPISGNTWVTGASIFSPLPWPFTRGWYTMSVTVNGFDTPEGFIMALAGGPSNPTMLMDSFRVIPPGMDESFCRQYEVHMSPIPALKYKVPRSIPKLKHFLNKLQLANNFQNK